MSTNLSNVRKGARTVTTLLVLGAVVLAAIIVLAFVGPSAATAATSPSSRATA
ncbi:MAG: hypothetical protein ACXWDI_15045 [Nocardioides sp.]